VLDPALASKPEEKAASPWLASLVSLLDRLESMRPSQKFVGQMLAARETRYQAHWAKQREAEREAASKAVDTAKLIEALHVAGFNPDAPPRIVVGVCPRCGARGEANTLCRNRDWGRSS
jgi:hypothetical protein